MSYILLVEDDVDLATTIIDYLELENLTCEHAANGIAGLQFIEQPGQTPFDVIILDMNMPRMDGLTVCKKLRAQGNKTPIIMLTARDTLADKLMGFEVGADDYLVKPFEMLELVARIRALSKRQSGQTDKFSIADFSANFAAKKATRNGHILHLSPTGWKLLELLMRKSPEVVSREQMSQAIWGEDAPDSNSLKVHLFKLRQQIDGNTEVNIENSTKSSHKLIHTIAGLGVSFGLKDGE